MLKSKANVFLISLIMMAVLLCFNSEIQAAQESDYTYTLTNGKAEVTKYNGAGGDVTIPSTLGGAPVTSIGKTAFSKCTSLINIKIPEGITNIGDGAFYDCTSLKNINIPSSVTTIAFLAFSGCTGLTEITVAVDNLNYASIDGILYDKTKTMLIICPEGKTSVSIPEGVVSICGFAFGDCSSLTSISLPSSVTRIYFGAFASCTGLTSISIPEGLTSIDDFAFDHCEVLKNISIPSSVTSIGDNAFHSCFGLTSITLNSATTTIPDDDGVTYTIPHQTTIIGYKDSSAEAYAEFNHRKFEVISSTPAAPTFTSQVNTPKVILDGTLLSFDVPPVIENGRVMVPLGAIFEAMGAKVSWDPVTMTATAIKGSTTVIFPIGSLEPTINGIVKPIDVAGKIVNGRTLAPLSFVCAAFGGTVNWDANTQTVSIKSAASSQASTILNKNAALFNIRNIGKNQDGTPVINAASSDFIVDHFVATPTSDGTGWNVDLRICNENYSCGAVLVYDSNNQLVKNPPLLIEGIKAPTSIADTYVDTFMQIGNVVFGNHEYSLLDPKNEAIGIYKWNEYDPFYVPIGGKIVITHKGSWATAYTFLMVALDACGTVTDDPKDIDDTAKFAIKSSVDLYNKQITEILQNKNQDLPTLTGNLNKVLFKVVGAAGLDKWFKGLSDEALKKKADLATAVIGHTINISGPLVDYWHFNTTDEDTGILIPAPNEI